MYKEQDWLINLKPFAVLCYPISINNKTLLNTLFTVIFITSKQKENQCRLIKHLPQRLKGRKTHK